MPIKCWNSFSATNPFPMNRDVPGYVDVLGMDI